jgi:hypothetical protein
MLKAASGRSACYRRTIIMLSSFAFQLNLRRYVQAGAESGALYRRGLHVPDRTERAQAAAQNRGRARGAVQVHGGRGLHSSTFQLNLSRF